MSGQIAIILRITEMVFGLVKLRNISIQSGRLTKTKLYLYGVVRLSSWN